jgi:carbonic anhydrase
MHLENVATYHSRKRDVYLEERLRMSNLDGLLKRNKEFAAEQKAAGTLPPSLPEVMPGLKATIICCADPRVDPMHVLGLKNGEAVVIRNIGGRITPGLLEELGMLGRIGQVAGKAPGGGGEFHLILMQHTDCGITRLVNDTAMLAHYFQIADGDVKAKTVNDPRAAVTGDLELLRSIPGLPAAWLLSGLVYDVKTGLVEVVVPPAPIRMA